MVREEEDGLWLVLEETIAFHPEEVFALLTTSGGLTRWFPVAARIDCRTGGEIVLGWDEKFSRRTTVAILEFDEGGRITWDWQPSTGDMHAPVYWSVEPVTEEGARVTLRQGPFRDQREALIALADEASTWRWHLCNMRSVMEARLDMRKVRPL